MNFTWVLRGSRNFVHGVKTNEWRFVFHGEREYFSLILQLMCQKRGGGGRHPNSPSIRAFECNCCFYDSITSNYWETRLPGHRGTCYTLTFFVLALLVKSKTPTQSATFTLYSLTRISRTSPAQIGPFSPQSQEKL